MYILDNNIFAEGVESLDKLLDLNIVQSDIKITTSVGRRNTFSKNPELFQIEYVDKASFYRMLIMGVRSGLKSYEEDAGANRHLTYMLDCSRNAAINVLSAKRLIGHLCVLGYRELSLYTEDTYEVKGEPCFGYLRGRYTANEIRELVDFAAMLGMNVSLSIQCLAHMRSIYRYETYYREAIDCNDVLMVGSERVETLLENIFSSIADMLPSKSINIGMDEAFMLGRGKYLDKNGHVSQGKLFLEQLKLIVKVAEKHEFNLKMWGDWIDGNYDNKEEILSFAKEHHIKIIFWHYGDVSEGEKTVQQVCDDISSHYLKERKELYPNCCFCVSDHKFFGLAPHNNLALHINQGYIDAAIACNIHEIWLSSWGDSGAEVSPFATLPVIAYVGYATVYNKKICCFEDFFECLFGSLQAFLKLDYANCLAEGQDLKCNTSSKYFLYQDVFMGVMDKSIIENYGDYYMKHIEELKIAKKEVAVQYSYLFNTQIKLMEVLFHKHNLGNRTREAFLKDDIKELADLVPIYQDVIGKIREFFCAFRQQWYFDNKVFGFEIHEARIGALLFRLQNCSERLDRYCNGEIEDIPELKEEILDLYGNGKNIVMLNWGELISSGVMIEYNSFV